MSREYGSNGKKMRMVGLDAIRGNNSVMCQLDQ